MLKSQIRPPERDIYTSPISTGKPNPCNEGWPLCESFMKAGLRPEVRVFLKHSNSQTNFAQQPFVLPYERMQLLNVIWQPDLATMSRKLTRSVPTPSAYEVASCNMSIIVSKSMPHHVPLGVFSMLRTHPECHIRQTTRILIIFISKLKIS